MGNKITRFVLLFEGRTGSTFIMSALDSHPNVISQGEILVGQDAQQQAETIRDLYQSTSDNIQAIGFKTKLRDIADTANFLSILDEFDVKVIFMYRKNLIKLALSRLNAKRLFQARGRWNLEKNEPPLPPFSPTIAEFEEALEFRKQKEEELHQFMQEVKRPIITLDYQDLLDDNEQLFHDYFDYINVEPCELQSPIVKNTDNNMSNILLNYAQIKQHYAGTRYAEMFD